MIHHFSIPAETPRHVASVLAELFEGGFEKFNACPNAFMVYLGDEHLSELEVLPLGTELSPDPDGGEVNFKNHPSTPQFMAFHALISTRRSEQEISEIAQREGWRVSRLSRGSFEVIEFWVENRVLLELMTPEMTSTFLEARQRGVRARATKNKR